MEMQRLGSGFKLNITLVIQRIRLPFQLAADCNKSSVDSVCIILPLFSSNDFVLLHIFSVLGINPTKGGLSYDISKAALDMVTKQFALELGQHQIRVNSVNPTAVLTETIIKYISEMESINKTKACTPLGRLCTMKEVVDPVMYLLSDHSSMVNGTIHVIDGGLLSCIPV